MWQIFYLFTLRVNAVHNVLAFGWLVAVSSPVFHRWINSCISTRAVKINKSPPFTTLMSDSFCTTYAQVHKRDASKNSLIWCWSADSEWKKGVVGQVMLFFICIMKSHWSMSRALQFNSPLRPVVFTCVEIIFMLEAREIIILTYQ